MDYLAQSRNGVLLHPALVDFVERFVFFSNWPYNGGIESVFIVSISKSFGAIYAQGIFHFSTVVRFLFVEYPFRFPGN